MSYVLAIPPGAWTWSTPLRAFVRVLTLDEAKAARRRAINVRRAAAEAAGCVTPAGRVNTDVDSQRKAAGASQMALLAQMAGQPFAIEWTMEDDLDLALDGPAMIALAVAMGLHVGACHTRARALKAEIEAADTIAAVEAVDIESGWPA